MTSPTPQPPAPAPILPQHREAAKELYSLRFARFSRPDIDNFAEVLARHFPQPAPDTALRESMDYFLCLHFPSHEMRKKLITDIFARASLSAPENESHPILEIMRAPKEGLEWHLTPGEDPNCLASWKERPKSTAPQPPAPAVNHKLVEALKVAVDQLEHVEHLRKTDSGPIPSVLSKEIVENGRNILREAGVL